MPSQVETVLTALGAVVTGDVEQARPLVAPDFVWHLPGDSAVGGDVSGVDGWASKLRRLIDAGLQVDVLDVLESTGRVAVLQRNHAEAGDLRLDVTVVNVFSLALGKVQRLDTFPGDQHAVERFWNARLGAA